MKKIPIPIAIVIALLLTFAACSPPTPDGSGAGSPEAQVIWPPAEGGESLSADVRCMEEAVWALVRVSYQEIDKASFLNGLRNVGLDACPADFAALYYKMRVALENRESEETERGQEQGKMLTDSLRLLMGQLKAAGGRSLPKRPDGKDELELSDPKESA